MKRFYYFIIAIFFASCTKAPIEKAPVHLPDSRYGVSLQDVKSYLHKQVGTKSSSITVDAITNEGDTVMFLVNYGEGWELLSGDLRMPQVLMKCEAGSISVNELQSINPYHKNFFNSLSESIHISLNSDEFSSPEYFEDTWLSSSIRPPFVQHITVLRQSDTVDMSVKKNHLLPTHWGQDSPWNQRMPFTDASRTSRCYSGCTMVATGQVLYYLNDKIGRPSSMHGSAITNAYIQSDSLILSASDVSFSNYSTGHWHNMPLISSGSDTPGASLVSSLFLRLGYLLEAEYKVTGTGAYIYPLETVLPLHYNVACDVERLYGDNDRFTQIVESEIVNRDMPVISSIYYRDSVDDLHYGHTIVVDGFYHDRRVVTNTYAEYNIPGDLFGDIDNLTPTRIFTATSEFNSKYVAINWGWDGSDETDDETGCPIWYNIYTNWVVGFTFNHIQNAAYGFRRN